MKANEPTETHISLIAGHGFSESAVPLASPSRVKMASTLSLMSQDGLHALPHESRWPPRFIIVCVLTHPIQKLEGSKGEWDKIFLFLNLLPLIMEENFFPIILFPYVLLADTRLIT